MANTNTTHDRQEYNSRFCGRYGKWDVNDIVGGVSEGNVADWCSDGQAEVRFGFRKGDIFWAVDHSGGDGHLVIHRRHHNLRRESVAER